VTPTPTAEKRRTSTWIYADRVTGVPFVRQLLVNTHIMSILLQRNEIYCAKAEYGFERLTAANVPIIAIASAAL
jgi:hypothetical protein